MTLRDIITFIFKWYKSLIACFLVIVVSVTILIYLLPRAYIAKSSVIIESNRGPNLRTDSMPGLDVAAVINTEIEILFSREVLENVVDEIEPHLNAANSTSIKKTITETFVQSGLLNAITPREAWIRSLKNNVQVNPVASSYVMDIEYAHEDPNMAANIVNTLTRHYIDHHIKVYTAEGIADFYFEQSKRAKQKLDSLILELENYKNEFHIPAIPDIRSSLTRSLGSFSEQVTQLKGEQTELLQKYNPSHTRVKLTKKKLANLNREINKTKQELFELDLRESKVSEMESLIDSSRTSYLHFVNLKEQAQMNELANSNTTSVRVINYAHPPAVPDHSRLFYIIIAIIAASIFSFTVAIVREYFDRKIDKSDQAEKILGIPVFGAIPYKR